MPRPSFGVHPKGDDADPDPDYVEEVSESPYDTSQPHSLPGRSLYHHAPTPDDQIYHEAAGPSGRARVSHSDTRTSLRSVTPGTTSTVDIDHHQAHAGTGEKRKKPRGNSELRRMAHGHDRDGVPRRKRTRISPFASKVTSRIIQVNIDQGTAFGKSVLVNSPPSAAAVEMSALSGHFINKKNAEAFISFIQQGVFTEEYIRSFFPLNAQPNQQPSEPTPAVMSVHELIEQACRENNMRRQVALGLYGQGEVQIGGQTGEFDIVDRTERCQTCTNAKRDCYRVKKDRFYTANTCALCFQMSKGCSFNEKRE